MKAAALLENMDSLVPADFFALTVELKERAMISLPDLSSLLKEEKFATLSLAWNQEGLQGRLVVDHPFEASFFPDYAKGEALELFIDTRDNKKSSCVSRFCHHFLLFPGEVNGIHVQEITKFRQDDIRPLAEVSLISKEIALEKKGYALTFTLPKEVLYGYDPLQFPKMGFAYRVHRYRGKPQHFPVLSKCFDLWQHPHLWVSLALKK